MNKKLVLFIFVILLSLSRIGSAKAVTEFFEAKSVRSILPMEQKSLGNEQGFKFLFSLKESGASLFDFYEKEFKVNNELSSVLVVAEDSDKSVTTIHVSENLESSVETTIEGLLRAWNGAHLSKDLTVFSDLFASSVVFYGTKQGVKVCVESKRMLFKRLPDFNQQLYGIIDIVKLDNDDYKCFFTKRVVVNEKTTDYPSYLVFRNFNGDWKIITESDLVTDKNLSKRKLPKTGVNNKQTYLFEPTVSTISGVLVVEKYWGPPGYGENPATDKSEYSYILLLEKPIALNSNSEKVDEGDFNFTRTNIAKIQLSSDQSIKLSDYKNKAIRLTGTFFGAFSGHHHTDVLLNVQTIEDL